MEDFSHLLELCFLLVIIVFKCMPCAVILTTGFLNNKNQDNTIRYVRKDAHGGFFLEEIPFGCQVI